MTDQQQQALFLGSITGQPEARQFLGLKWANRHGLIAGATGTGKTVTLQVLAEGFSNAGVPVFMADVKGDLGGLAMPSEKQDFLLNRAETIGFQEYKEQAFPVVFWDMFGEQGNAVRTTISEMGPLLLGRLLDLNDTQEGVLTIAFHMADQEGLLLLDLKDLQSLLAYMAEHSSEISKTYGQVSKASIGAIQRALLQFVQQGGERFFGEPALDLNDFIRCDGDGRGYVNILLAEKLMRSPRLYSTFLLWLMAELFEELPEVGDQEKPRVVFFFDEAHLLFKDAPKALMEKIEQVVRLIRSKGVGIYFITQNPQDIPETVLGQLGNRVQHALRAFTPQQQDFIKKAAKTYRSNPDIDVEEVISTLVTGEALVSTLQDKGEPGIAQRVLIRPPSSRLGPATAEARRVCMMSDGLSGRYTQMLDRESAYEILQGRAAQEQAQDAQKAAKTQGTSKAPSRPQGRSSSRQSTGEALVKSVVRSMGSSLGRTITREIVRGVMGSMRR
ncbi:MAG: helicase HerA-like domain-containing protein [Micavibrio sp.]